MNVYRFRRLTPLNTVLKFRYYSSLAQAENEIEVLHKQDPKITKNVTGINVASVENYNPISHIAVLVKAGSRYEAGKLGIAHTLRTCASLSTESQTAFAITRKLELHGAKLSVVSTREHLLYTLECLRNDADMGIELLADVVTHPALKPWEISDSVTRMKYDIAVHQQNPESVLMEALHNVAFRGGLSNSLYCPIFNLNKHTSEMLEDYVKTNFIPSNTSIIGLGISHDHLENSVTKFFSLEDKSYGDNGVSNFGGGELRIESDTPHTRVAIVAQGVGLNNLKDMLSLGILQCIMGSGSHTKYSSLKFSKLGEAASKHTKEPFTVSSLNINYSDMGLFGVYLAGQPNDMDKLLEAIVSEMRNMTKYISEESVQAAKHMLKTKLRLERQTQKELLYAKAIEVATHGQIKDFKEIDNIIDGLTPTDVTTMAAKVMKTKPAMAAYGPLHSTPHLDELL